MYNLSRMRSDWSIGQHMVIHVCSHPSVIVQAAGGDDVGLRTGFFKSGVLVHVCGIHHNMITSGLDQ